MIKHTWIQLLQVSLLIGAFSLDASAQNKIDNENVNKAFLEAIFKTSSIEDKKENVEFDKNEASRLYPWLKPYLNPKDTNKEAVISKWNSPIIISLGFPDTLHPISTASKPNLIIKEQNLSDLNNKKLRNKTRA